MAKRKKGYADLTRMDMGVMDLAVAAAQSRAGLEWNPHHPTLQGLWAYAALQAQRGLEDDSLTLELIDGLRRLPVDTSDGWFRLSAAYEERHDIATTPVGVAESDPFWVRAMTSPALQ